MEVNLSRIQIWRTLLRYIYQVYQSGRMKVELQGYRSKGGIKVNISKIEAWRKTGGKYIKNSGLEEEWR